MGDLSEVIIQGQWATDDAGELFINGIPTGITSPASGEGLRSFTLNCGFAPTLNRLQFRVTNSSGANGLRVQFDTPSPSPAVAFAASSYSVNENEGTVTLQVALSAPSSQTVTVDYAVTAATATADEDYQLPAGNQLVFAPGVTERPLTIQIINDPLNEAPETVEVRLGNPSFATLGDPAATVLTITDDDPQPEVTLAKAAFALEEPFAAQGIVVQLSAPSGQLVSVDLATMAGTATAGADYQTISETLTFLPGQTELSVGIPILDDDLNEDDETFSVSLSNPAGATLGDYPTATLTIRDDDPLPAVQFPSASFSYGEAVGTVQLPVVLNAPSGRVVTVQYTVTGGTATAGADYGLPAINTLTFNPGQTQQLIHVSVVNDSVDEPAETIHFELSNPIHAQLDVQQTATLTLLDNDPDRITLRLFNDTSGGQLITRDGRLSGQINGPGYLDGDRTVTFSGGVTGSVVADEVGDYLFDPGLLAEGTYSDIVASYVDDTGTVVSSAPLTFVFDDRAPSVTLTGDSPTNLASPQVTVHATDFADDAESLADGTPAAIDVDLNHDGTFTGTERGHTMASLTDGQVEVSITPALAPGTYQVRARVTDVAGNEGVSDELTLTVVSGALAVVGYTVQPTEGLPFTDPVAWFTDFGAGGTSTDFTATITWQPGVATPGMVAVAAGGGFEVSGNYAYALRGTFPLSVSVTRLPSGPSASGAGSAVVQDATLWGQGVDLTAVEGQPLTRAVMATFTDDNPNGSSTDYTATIDWGDGTAPQSAHELRANNGVWEVVGPDHTYNALAGSVFNVTVTITSTGEGGNSTAPVSTVTLTDAAMRVLPASPVTATEGVPLTDVRVGTLTDGYLYEDQEYYGVAIQWGDGETSDGRLQATEGGYDILGDHTYRRARPEPYAIQITVTDLVSEGQQSATTSAMINEAAVTVDNVPLLATQGVDTGPVTVARFLDANPFGRPEDFRAQVHWGDEQSGPALAIVQDSDSQTFYVQARHTYAAAGHFDGSVAIQNVYNVTLATADLSVEVQPDAPRVGLTAPAYTNLLAPVVSVTVTDAAGNPLPDDTTVHLAVDLDGNGTFDNTAEREHTSPMLMNGVATFAINALPGEGRYLVQAWAVNANDEEGRSEARTIIVDQTAPTVTLETPLQATTRRPQVTIRAQDNEGLPNGTLVYLDVDLDDNGVYGAGERGHTENLLAGGESVFLTRMLPRDGYFWMQARVIDRAGNAGVSPELRVLVDATPPDVELLGPTLTNNNRPEITVVVADNRSLESEDMIRAYLDIDRNRDDKFDGVEEVDGFGQTLDLDDEDDTIGQTVFQVDPELADGTYWVRGRSRDVLGNEGSAAYQITIDTTPPVVVVNGPGITNDTTPPITLTATDVNGLPAGTPVEVDLDLDGDNAFEADGEFGFATGVLGAGGTVTLTLPEVPEGIHLIQARVTDRAGNEGRGQQLLVIDLTPPTVVVQAPARINTRSPQITILAADAYGLPTGTPVALDVDRNGDNIFTPDELNYQPGLTLSGGSVTFTLSPPLDLGSYHLQARVRDRAGNEGTSPAVPLTIAVWDLSAYQRRNDPERATFLPVGTAEAAPNTGGLRLAHPLDFDRSPGTAVGGDPMLVYNSETVAVRPLLEAVLPGDGDAPAPTRLDARLSWNGGPFGAPVTFTPAAGQDPRSTYLLAVQLATPLTQTGVYPWQLEVTAVLPGDVTVTRLASGLAHVVVRDQGNPLGAGWGISTVHRLVGTAGGVLLVYGTGDSRYFVHQGGGTYQSPPDDFGTLRRNADGSFTYTAKDQTRWEFDGAGRLRRDVDPHDLALRYDYDLAGRLQWVSTPDGGVTELQYSGNRLDRIHEPGKAVLAAFYPGAEPLLQRLTNPDDAQRLFQYDGQKRLHNERWDLINSTYSYDPASGLLTAVDRGLGTVHRITSAAGQGLVLNPVRTLAAAVATATDGLDSHRTTWTLDTLGRVTRLARADGVTQTWTRNPAGQMLTHTDGRGRTTIYTYDGAGDLRRTDRPDNSTLRYAYHPLFHHVTVAEDGRGNRTTSTYDPQTGDLLSVRNALDQVTTFTYYQDATGRSNGLVRTLTDARHQTTTYQYDGQRRLWVTTDARGQRTTQLYDAAGNPWRRTDALGRLSETRYDGLNRMEQQRDAAGNLSAWQYNGQGQVLRATDAAGRVTTYLYDQRGWQTEMTEAATGTSRERRQTTWDYDAAGNVRFLTTGISDNPAYAKRAVTRSDYDVVNRLTEVREDWRTVGAVELAARITSLRYDASDNVIWRRTGRSDTTEQNVAVTRYQYDGLDRLTRTYEGVRLPNGDAYPLDPPPADEVAFTYDRLTSQEYDQAGNLHVLVSGQTPGGLGAHVVTTVYDYDVLNRRISTREAADSGYERRTTRGYDAAGNLAWVTTGATPHLLEPARSLYEHASTTRYAYDELNRRTATYEGWREVPLPPNAAGPPVPDYDRLTTYAYDAVGNVAFMTTGRSTTQMPHVAETHYAYDSLDRRTHTYEHWRLEALPPGLVGPPAPRYDRLTIGRYDAVGNLTRLSTGLTTDAARAHVSTTSFVYDALDRRTEVHEAINTGVQRLTTMLYDAADNLVAVTTGQTPHLPAMARSTYEHIRTTEYAYDLLNRRVETIEAAQVLAGGRAEAGTGGSLTDNDQSWTPNVWKGNALTILSGPGAGQTRRIVGNSLTRIDVERPFDVAPGADSVYVIGPAERLRSTVQYDAADNVVEVRQFSNQDSRTIVTRHFYDRLNRRLTTTEATANLLTGWLLPLPGGGLQPNVQRSTQLFYDSADNLREMTTGTAPLNQKEVTTVYDYDTLNRRTSICEGAAIEQRVPPGGTIPVQVLVCDRRTTLSYDAADNLRELIDPRKTKTRSDYDRLNQRRRVTEAAGVPGLERTTTMIYDAAGNPEETIDPLGRRMRFTYDLLNRRTAVTEALGRDKQRTTRLGYDAADNLVALTRRRYYDGYSGSVPAGDRLDVTTRFTYDALNRRTEVTEAWEVNARQRTTTTAYDAADNVRQVIDPLEREITFVHDSLNRPIERIESLSQFVIGRPRPTRTTKTGYDGFGNVWYQEDGYQNRTTFTYDALHRRIRVEQPPNLAVSAAKRILWDLQLSPSVTQIAYDSQDNSIRTIDPVGQTTTYEYDRFHRQTRVIDGRGAVTQTSYDELGNVLQVTDADNNTTYFHYDALGRRDRVRDPLGRRTDFGYDRADRPEWTIDRNGRRRQFAYDDLNRLEEEKWYRDAGQVNLTDTLTFTYDAADNRLTARNSNGGYVFTYDVLDRVKTVQAPFSMGLTFAYDAVGNRQHVQDSFGGVEGSTYDDIGRLRHRSYRRSGVTPFGVDLKWTRRDQLFEVNGIQRTAEGTRWQIAAHSLYEYDRVGRLVYLNQTATDPTYVLATPTVFRQTTFGYDPAGRLRDEYRGESTIPYQYDQADQLTVEGKTTFGYTRPGGTPGSGNRTLKHDKDGQIVYRIGPGNRLREDKAWYYPDYDQEGNLLRKVSKATEVARDGRRLPVDTYTYRYDNANRLIGVTHTKTLVVTSMFAQRFFDEQVEEVVYAYDALGNRLSRSVTAFRRSGLPVDTPNRITRFAYDGAHVWADVNVNPATGEATLERRYLSGQGADQLVASVSDAGRPWWYLTDRMGSVVGVVDDRGRIEKAYSYTAFGEQKTERDQNRDQVNWYGYTGRESDPVAQLQYNRARYYDPNTGRWISEDPIGFAAGDPNLYRYVGNSSPNATDPSGNVPVLVTGAIGAVIGGVIGGVSAYIDSGGDWNAALRGAGKGALVGGIIGLTGGAAAGAVAWGFGVTGAAAATASTGSVVGATLVGGAAAGVTGDAAGQASGWAFDQIFGGETSGKSLWQSYHGWQTVGAGLGGFLGAGLNLGIGRLAGMALRPACSGACAAGVSAGGLRQYGRVLGQFTYPGATGAAGGAVGDAVTQGLEIGAGRQPGWNWNRFWTSTGSGAVTGIATYGALKVCFVAGTPLLTLDGAKAIERFQVGDWLLSSPENDPEGPVAPRQVEEVFVRVGPLWDLRVQGRLIQTTAEHPFYVRGKGWLRAAELQPGDLLRSHDGQWVAVEAVTDSGAVTTVYNLRVAEYHTYFVGDSSWGFSVWAHNMCTPEELAHYKAVAESDAVHPMARLAAKQILAQEAAYAQARTANAGRHAAWAGDMDQINGTMARLARRALREGGGSWERAEAALSRYAEAMNNRFQRVGSTKRAVVDATVVDGSGLRNGGYGTRAEPWGYRADGSRYPMGGTRRIELGIESTALPGRPIVSAVDISYSYTKPFLWTEYTNSYGLRVPIADVRMSRNLRNLSDPILNYVEWRRGGSVISRQEFGRQGLPEGW